MLAVYALLTVAASIAACRQDRHWLCLPILPVVFLTYHLSYGIGFWRGIWDVSTGQQPDAAFSALVR
jgi:hypothetical protein